MKGLAIAMLVWISGTPLSAVAGAGDCVLGAAAPHVALEAPAAIAKRMRELVEVEAPGDARLVLRRQLAALGCPQLEEQPTNRGTEPNLVCTVPGGGAGLIVVGTSPEFHGRAAAALLPALATTWMHEARQHTLALVAFSRAKRGEARGAWAFAESLAESSRPKLFVHIGAVGFGAPSIAPGTDRPGRCALSSIARTLEIELSETTLAQGYSGACRPIALGRQSTVQCIPPLVVRNREATDRAPFERGSTRIAGIDALVPAAPQFDSAQHYRAYRLLASFLVVSDTAPR